METLGFLEVVGWFLDAKRAEGRAKDTTMGYRHILKSAAPVLSPAWPDEKRLRAAVRSYMAGVQERYAPSVARLHRGVLSSFFAWATAEGLTASNPVAGLRVKADHPRPRPASPEDLRRLLAVVPQDSYVGIRDRAVIMAMIDTGIRPAELRRLLPVDVDTRFATLRVRAEVAKTGRERALPLSRPTVQAIRRLLAVRPQSWPDSTPLFASENGTPMARETLVSRFQLYSRRAGVHIVSYQLRHSCATELLRAGADLLTVQRLLGHTTPQMTARYVELLPDDIRRIHSQHSPLGLILPPERAKRKVGGRQ